MPSLIPIPKECPACNSESPPVSASKVASEGWIVFFVLLFLCFPLCFIGLLIRDKYQACASCGIELGKSPLG